VLLSLLRSEIVGRSLELLMVVVKALFNGDLQDRRQELAIIGTICAILSAAGQESIRRIGVYLNN
jgi:hypothetical protein